MERLFAEFYGPSGTVQDLIHRVIVRDWWCHVQLRVSGGGGESSYTQTYTSGGWYNPRVFDVLELNNCLLCSIEVPVVEKTYDWTVTPIVHTSSVLQNLVWYYTGRPLGTVNCVTQVLLLLRKACPPLFTHNNARDIKSPLSLFEFLRCRLPSSTIRLGPEGVRLLEGSHQGVPSRHPWCRSRRSRVPVGAVDTGP